MADPCGERSQLLLRRRPREAIQYCLVFATERSGGSGVVFAWDLGRALS